MNKNSYSREDYSGNQYPRNPYSRNSNSRKRRKKKKNGLLIALWIVLGVLVVGIGAFIGCRNLNGTKAQQAANALLDLVTGNKEDGMSVDAVDIELKDQAGEAFHSDEGDDESLVTSTVYQQPESPAYSEKEMNDMISKIAKKTDGTGVIGIVRIPSLDIKLPIIGEWSDALLKVSVCRYYGDGPNLPGHFVVVGHNYKNGAHFGKLKKIKVGDEVFLADAAGYEKRYVVYETEVVAADDFSALDKYKGECGLSLVTCYQDGTNRLFVRCEQKDK